MNMNFEVCIREGMSSLERQVRELRGSIMPTGTIQHPCSANQRTIQHPRSAKQRTLLSYFQSTQDSSSNSNHNIESSSED